MRIVLIILFILLSINVSAQTFTYSGYIYNSNGSGATNVPVKLYQRTTPVMSGFTSQTNYNGHSYYRSTGVATWTSAQQACAAMGGHLVTMSNAAENNFVYSTWPSGWIGYYQDKTGAFYGEPNAGWRWTETPVTNGQVCWYNISNVVNDTVSAPGITLNGTNMRIWNSVSYSGSGYTITDINGNANAVMYNSPSYSSSGGKYISFNGSNNYALLNDISSKLSSSVISIQMWIYPTGNGVILDELGVMSTSSVWHESVFEITGSNTLNCGLWNGSSISKVTSSISLNTWHCIGLTYDGSTLKGYLDGTNFGSTTFSRQVPFGSGGGENFAIGLADATNMGSGAYGSFRLGDLSIYKVSLTSDQMNRNYMAGAFRYGVYPYSAWNGGEPNNSGGEDYIQFVGGGLWNDLNNYNSLNYVLEFDTVITYTPWAYYGTYYTDTNGKYNISVPTNPSLDWQLEYDAVTPASNLSTVDYLGVSNVILKRTTFNGLHYYQYDVNGDNKVSVADLYYIIAKSVGRFSSWGGSTFISQLFTPLQYTSITGTTSNMKLTYPGVSSIIITSATSGGTANYYLIAPGYANKVTY